MRPLVSRRGEAAERFAERRKREDEAPRLRDVAPELSTCRVDIGERRADATATAADVTYTRHLVVERAPAMLVVPCADPACKNGGHDITPALLEGFRQRQTAIRGEDICKGEVATVPCGRVLTFIATCTYEPTK